MSSRTLWVRGPICGVDNCRSRLYRSADGHKVCQYGHVMEGQIEINDDQDDNYTVTRRLNIQLTGIGGDFSQRSVGRGGQGSLSQDKQTRLYGMAGRRHYLRVLQLVFRKQMEIICTQLVSLDEDAIKAVELQAKIYWLRLVSQYWNVHGEHANTTETQQTQNNKDNGDLNGVSLADSQPKINTPTVLDSIAIIFLVLMEQNHTPVYVTDFLRWIKLNRIPYIKTFYLVPASLLEPLPQHYYNLLQPPNLPVQNELINRISQSAMRLVKPLQQPSKPDEIVPVTVSVNYYYSWVYKILSDRFIFPSTISIFHMVCHFTAILDIDRLRVDIMRPDVFPEVQMMAIVIFSIKFSFLFKITKVNYRQWIKQLHQLDFTSPDYLASLDQLIHWSDEKVNQYCDWVYSNLLPTSDAQETSIMKKRLHQIFEYPEPDRSSPVPSGATARSHLEKLLDSSKKPKTLSKSELLQLETTLVSIGLDLLGVTEEVIVVALDALELRISTQIRTSATVKHTEDNINREGIER